MNESFPHFEQSAANDSEHPAHEKDGLSQTASSESEKNIRDEIYADLSAEKEPEQPSPSSPEKDFTRNEARADMKKEGIDIADNNETENKGEESINENRKEREYLNSYDIDAHGGITQTDHVETPVNEALEDKEEKRDRLFTKLESLTKDLEQASQENEWDEVTKIRKEYDATVLGLREMKAERKEAFKREQPEQNPVSEEDPVLKNTSESSKETPAPEPEKAPSQEKLTISQEGLQDFEVTGEDGEKIRFGDLSDGKQQMALENYRQIALGEIKSQALENYRRDQSELGQKATKGATGLKKFMNMAVNWRDTGKLIKSSTLKGNEIGKREQEVKKEFFNEGGASQSEFLTEIIKQTKEGPEVTYEDGKQKLAYLSAEKLGEEAASPEMQEKIAAFNKAANEYAYAPEKNAEVSEEFEKEKGAMLASLERAHGPEEAMKMVNNIERDVNMSRLFNNHPDVEKALSDIDDMNFWKEGLKGFGKTKLNYLALGGVIRGGTGMALAGFGAATVAGLGGAVAGGAAVGGVRGYFRGGTETKEREQLAQSGRTKAGAKSYASAEDLAKQMEETQDSIDNIAEAGRGKDFEGDQDSINRGLSEKLESLTERVQNEQDPEKRAKLVDSLNARIAYTQDKIETGKINYGSGAEQIKNRYGITNALAKAKAERLFFDNNPEGNEIVSRLDGFLSQRESRIDKAKHAYRMNQAKKGAKIGVGWSFFGASLISAGAYAADEAGASAEPQYEYKTTTKTIGGGIDNNPNTSETPQGTQQNANEEVRSMPAYERNTPGFQETFDKNEPSGDEQNTEAQPERPDGYTLIRDEDIQPNQETPSKAEETSSLETPSSEEMIRELDPNKDALQQNQAEEATSPETSESTQKLFEKISQPHTVKPGDNIWNILEERIQGQEFFDDLSPEQQDFVIDSVHDQVKILNEEQLKNIGIESGDPNVIQPGETLKLGEVYKNSSVLENAMAAAEDYEKAPQGPEVPDDPEWLNELFPNENDVEAIEQARSEVANIDTPKEIREHPAWNALRFEQVKNILNEDWHPDPDKIAFISGRPDTTLDQEIDQMRESLKNLSGNLPQPGPEQTLNDYLKQIEKNSGQAESASQPKQEISGNSSEQKPAGWDSMTAQEKRMATSHYEDEATQPSPETQNTVEAKPPQPPEQPEQELSAFQQAAREVRAEEAAKTAAESSSETQEASGEDEYMSGIEQARQRAFERARIAQEEAGKSVDGNTRVADVEMSEGEVTRDNLENASNNISANAERAENVQDGLEDTLDNMRDITEEVSDPDENSLEEVREGAEDTQEEINDTLGEVQSQENISSVEKTEQFAKQVGEMPAKQAMYNKEWNTQENNIRPPLSKNGGNFLTSFREDGENLQSAMRKAQAAGFEPLEDANGNSESVGEFIARASSQNEAVERLFEDTFENNIDLLRGAENTA